MLYQVFLSTKKYLGFFFNSDVFIVDICKPDMGLPVRLAFRLVEDGSCMQSE